MQPFKIVIPARHGSTRLPGKPLLNLAGRPMIVHVCERALEAGGEVFVATDDLRIQEAVKGLEVTAVMTREDHASGSERITEVADQLGWSDDTLIVNLQGDEPLMDPRLIQQLAEALGPSESARTATLAARIQERQEIFDPNAVKVVIDGNGHALYFSRAPIPWDRASFSTEGAVLKPEQVWYRHIGIYAYTTGFLRDYIRWPTSPLETVESLEQLRILYQGEKIRVVPVDSAPQAGVDTGADLARVDLLLRSR